MIFKDHIDDYFDGDDDDDIDDPKVINDEIKLIIKDKRKKTIDKMVKSCKEGVMRGCITGCITGGVPGAISGGILFGVANPIITYMNDVSEKKERNSNKSY
jgi:hypothetical protein